MAVFGTKMENEEIDELPPDIESYIEQVSGDIPVDISDQEELLFKLRARTGLEIDVLKIIVNSLFQEIRNEVINGNEIYVSGLGKFFLGKHGAIYFVPANKLAKLVKNL